MVAFRSAVSALLRVEIGTNGRGLNRRSIISELFFDTDGKPVAIVKFPPDMEITRHRSRLAWDGGSKKTDGGISRRLSEECDVSRLAAGLDSGIVRQSRENQRSWRTD